jgi:predicted DNA binding CopG/RHH family protein
MVSNMKIVRKEETKDYRTVTLRIEQKIMAEVDKIAEKSGLSRQSLIAAILKQVLDDPKFVLRVDE